MGSEHSHPAELVESAVTTAACRDTLGLFATGVTVITICDPSTGEPRGMTANAFMSVSLEPPLVVVAVRVGAHMHDGIRRARAYGVSVLSEGMERDARRFAGQPVAVHEPLPAFAVHDRVPVLAGALAWLVARVAGTHAAGDHTLYVGEITDLSVAGQGDAAPLAFYRSRFARVSTPSLAGSAPMAPWDHGLDSWG
jgi:flavin reductase (DIM6/NTAB) family NADH-FMN oxidoreductase RutF